MAGLHNTRSARITFRDCEVNALPCMGFLSQFTDTMTFERVNGVRPVEAIRTCPARVDIFQSSNCKEEVVVDFCRLSFMQEDALNCHGACLVVVGKGGDRQLLVRSPEQEEPVHENVRIRNNKFNTFENSGIVVRTAVQGLLIEGNESTPYPLKIYVEPSRTAVKGDRNELKK